MGGICDYKVGMVSVKEVSAVSHLMSTEQHLIRVQNRHCYQQSKQEHKFIHKQLMCVQLEQVVKIWSSEAVLFLQEVTQIQ